MKHMQGNIVNNNSTTIIIIINSNITNDLCTRAHVYINITFLQILSMSLNSNFYDFSGKIF